MDSYYAEAPSEIAEKFLLSLNSKDLQEACKTNRLYASVCRNNSFWKRKTYYDYNRNGLIYQPKAGNTWKDVWIEITYGLIFKYYFAQQNNYVDDYGYTDVDVVTDFEITDVHRKVYEIVTTKAMPDIIEYLKYDDYHKKKFDISDKFDMYINDDSIEVVLYPNNVKNDKFLSMRERVGNLYDEINEYLSEALRLSVIETPTKYVDEDLYDETEIREIIYFNEDEDEISENEYYDILDEYGNAGNKIERIAKLTLANEK